MNGIHVQFLCNLYNFIAQKIGFVGRWRAYANGFICKLYVGRISICFRKNGNRFNAHISGGFHDSQCNFASIGDQYFLNHFFPIQLAIFLYRPFRLWQ